MISLIVATSENNVIGKDNELLWNLSDDLKNFKKLTSGNTVIMGRKTFESIGRPLPNRLNIVVTRQKGLSIHGAIVVNSIEDGIRKAPNDKETFIIGGSQIYKQSIKYAETIYMTEVHDVYEGDSFFMDKDSIKASGFREVSREKWMSDEKNECDYSFIKYKR